MCMVLLHGLVKCDLCNLTHTRKQSESVVLGIWFRNFLIQTAWDLFDWKSTIYPIAEILLIVRAPRRQSSTCDCTNTERSMYKCLLCWEMMGLGLTDRSPLRALPGGVGLSRIGLAPWPAMHRREKHRCKTVPMRKQQQQLARNWWESAHPLTATAVSQNGVYFFSTSRGNMVVEVCSCQMFTNFQVKPHAIWTSKISMCVWLTPKSKHYSIRQQGIKTTNSRFLLLHVLQGIHSQGFLQLYRCDQNARPPQYVHTYI